ncbi:MAG: tetratricopeptide repeat protein [Thermodesulfobacteriota bacterium]
MSEGQVQLDLFDSIQVPYNHGVRLLLALRFAEAERVFQQYARDYPGWRDLAVERTVCRVLQSAPLDGMKDAEEAVRRSARIFTDLERELIGEPGAGALMDELRPVFFQAVASAADRLRNAGRPVRVGPEVLAGWYYLAGRFAEAGKLLKPVLAAGTEAPGRTYVLMGDILYRLGEAALAREYYREAFSRRPEEMAAGLTADPEVNAFVAGLGDDEGAPEPSLFWVAPVGLIRGVFPFPVLHAVEALAAWQKEFAALAAEPRTPPNDARLFYLAVVLDRRDPSPLKERVIYRRALKKLAPDLFQEYLAGLGLWTG